jgi:uncharacterized protein (TIGR00730 family)
MAEDPREIPGVNRVCVFAGSAAGRRASYTRAAEALAEALLRRGIGLVFGGGRVGLMGVLADRMLTGGGEVIGVIPGALMERELGHGGVTELRVVSSMHERKATMAELSEGFIALPGGSGTLEELFEVFTWGVLGIHGKPVGLLNADGYYDPLVAFLDRAVEEGFLRPAYRDMLVEGTDPGDLLDRFETYRPPETAKWIDGPEI